MNSFENRLILILFECNRHKKMIEFSFGKLERHLPLSVDIYDNFDDEQIAIIDQFVFRFSKLQDTMGERLFITLLHLLNEDYSKKPFIDVLNRLEKMELLYKEEWIRLRKIRNTLAHEYIFNIDEIVESLNSIFDSKTSLLNIYKTFYDYSFERFEFIRESKFLQKVEQS